MYRWRNTYVRPQAMAAVGAAGFCCETVVMMHLSGVMGFTRGASAAFLATIALPNALLMLFARPYLRLVLPWSAGAS